MKLKAVIAESDAERGEREQGGLREAKAGSEGSKGGVPRSIERLDTMTREDAATKARRLLVEARMNVVEVSPTGSGRSAEADSAELYDLASALAGGTTPARRSACAGHVKAPRLVTIVTTTGDPKAN